MSMRNFPIPDACQHKTTPSPLTLRHYTESTLKFLTLNTQAQQREAVVQGRSL
ncbi:MAG: hypothetical protein LBJ00_01050 [Planctomycetaceae bacterium]|nr:hypothetical protein [Planctomycetaceae bacterium]